MYQPSLENAVCYTVHLTTQSVCSPEAKERRKELFHSVLNSEAPEKGDELLRALAAYGLAFDACLAQDADTWEAHLKQSHAAWAEVGNQPMLNFINQHRAHGCCTQSAMEMGGVMDGHELRFRDQTLSSMPRSGGNVGPSATSVAKGVAAAKAASGGKAAASIGGKGKVAMVGPRPDTAAKQVEAELKAGYEMYQRDECAPLCETALCPAFVQIVVHWRGSLNTRSKQRQQRRGLTDRALCGSTIVFCWILRPDKGI
jgi:hypothetical protein